jgi:hypothetical protein
MTGRAEQIRADRSFNPANPADFRVHRDPLRAEKEQKTKPVFKRDFEQEWRRADRKAWEEYRKWEDQRFPYDPAKPWKDPPGMVAARRAFEREQEISKAKEILRLREASRVR